MTSDKAKIMLDSKNEGYVFGSLLLLNVMVCDKNLRASVKDAAKAQKQLRAEVAEQMIHRAAKFLARKGFIVQPNTKGVYFSMVDKEVLELAILYGQCVLRRYGSHLWANVVWSDTEGRFVWSSPGQPPPYPPCMEAPDCPCYDCPELPSNTTTTPPPEGYEDAP